MEWLIKPKQKPKLQGKYNFQLFISDETIDSSSTVSITAFTDRSQRAAVPCNYIWFLIKNGVPQEVPDFRGSSFICETSHIGCQLQAHIISNDPQYGGKAIITLGPIELDVNLKTEILNSLSQGYSNQAVYLLGGDQQEKECTIQVYEQKIKVMHAFSDLTYIFDYSLLQPLFTHHPKQINHLTIFFSQKYQQELKRFERRLFVKEQQSVTRSSIKQNSSNQNTQAKLDIRFLNRAQRDIFLYTIKGFIAKRQIKNSAVVRKIEKINFQTNQQFGAIIEINQLRRDLARYDRAYKKLANDRKKLQQNLQSSIYSRNEQTNPKGSTNFMKKQDGLPLKYIQIERQNEALNHRILALVQEVNQLKQNATVIMNPPQKINFTKKKQPEENTITYLLDDLNRSEQMVHFDAQNQFLIDRIQSQKRVLQMNLDQANQKIANLQRKNKNSPQGTVSVQKSVFDRLRAENEDLKRINERIDRDLRQTKDLIQQLKTENFQKSQASQMRTSDSQHLQRQIEDLRSQLAICERQLEEQTRIKENLQDKYINLTRKYSDLEIQTQMYRKNQDVLNRSQAISEQMQDYNEQQIKILKQHNSFLVNENQKLAKACEKYMAEAKQAIKLRQEILQLKEKLNSAYTNPENQSFV